MGPSRFNLTLLVTFFLANTVDAFTTTVSPKVNILTSLNNNNNRRYQSTQWRMVDEDKSSTATEEAPTRVSSSKDISFDEKSGRFYDNEGECLPDDEYCAVDKKSGKLIRLTMEEKERIFLDSLQSFYINGRQLLSDAEFDLLKEDLSWNGSNMVVMNRKEAQYLSAMQTYLKGEPTLSDEKYNELKNELREEGSKFAVSLEPKCYIDSGICTVTFLEDSFRTNLLYLPAGLLVFTVWLGLGYEIIGLFAKINPIIIAVGGLPLVYRVAAQITDKYIFANNKVAYGPCPSCEVENRVFFGDILGVEGYGKEAQVKCCNKKCKTVFKVQRDSMRASTVPK